MNAVKKAMLKALEKTLGRVNEAAAKVKISRSSHYLWLTNDPEYKKRVESINDMQFEFVEGKLMELIDGYSHKEDKIFLHEGKPVIVPTVKRYPPDNASVIFYLKTKGKSRGYTQTEEFLPPPTTQRALIDFGNGITVEI